MNLIKAGIPIFLFLLQASPHEGTSDLEEVGLTGLRDVRYRHFLEVSRSITYSTHSSSSRTKRSAIFSTGVKVCPQETAKAVISSHRAYYKLRVCQEAIWEAFRIFFDRVPNSEEYMKWVYACQHENLCMDDLARNFSSSPEHLDMVASRVAELEESEGVLVETPEPGRDCPFTPQYKEIPTEPSEVTDEPNAIPEKLQQYVVEFSVTVEDPIYGEMLQDPTAPQYADVIRDLRDKMYHVFEKIPGFKEIRVVGFRAEDVSVRYAVLFNGDTELSDQPEGYYTTDIETQKEMTAPKLKNIIIKALKQELSLPLDLNTLSFNDVYEVDEYRNKISHTVAPEGSSATTAAAVINREETHTVFNPEVKTDLSWTEREQTPAQPAVEHPSITEEEKDVFSAESVATETKVVMPVFTTDTPTQTEEQATVPTALEVTVQQPMDDTLAPAEEEDDADKSNKHSVAPAEEDILTGTGPENSWTDEDSPLSSEDTLLEGDSGLSPEDTVLEKDSGLSPKDTVAEGDSGLSSEDTVPEGDTRVSFEDTVLEKDSGLSPKDTVAEGDSGVSSEDTVPEEDSGLSSEDTVLEGDSGVSSEDTVPEEDSGLSSEDTVLEKDSGLSENSIPVGDSRLIEGDSGSGLSPDSRLIEGDSGSGLSPDSRLIEGDSGSGLSPGLGPYEVTRAPAMRQASTPVMAAVDRSRDLVVLFSLRVTNMMFTDSLVNKDSLEYKSLENTFLELRQRPRLRKPQNPGASSKSRPQSLRTLASIPLLPYLETNLTGFKALEILSFQNGSVIVNSRMKLNKAVPYNVTEAVHCVLEDFCNAASNQMEIQVDSRSLEVEQADEPDPCKSMSCSEFSHCVVNGWSGEGECMCEPGYSSVDGQPCQSLCTLEPNFCLNGGLCQIIPGHGATCRCPVGKHWHYHGERCDELVTLPMDTSFIVTGLVGSVCLVAAVIAILIFINKKCIKPQKAVTVVQTLIPHEFDSTLRDNPVFQNDDDEFLSQLSTLPYPPSSVSSQPQLSEHEHFASIENIHLSIEIPRQLYTTRSEKLVSTIADFHHCIPHTQTWRASTQRRCCLLRASEKESLEVSMV